MTTLTGYCRLATEGETPKPRAPWWGEPPEFTVKHLNRHQKYRLKNANSERQQALKMMLSGQVERYSNCGKRNQSQTQYARDCRRHARNQMIQNPWAF